MKTLSEKQALIKLRELKNDLRANIKQNYEHRAKDCGTCETKGACCLDAHFVNVHITKLEAVYDEIVAAGFPQPAILPMDYLNATQAELDAFAQSILTTFGRLDVVFHGASHFVSCMPLALHDLDMWQQHARVNLGVPAALTKACMPLLERAADASVIFLTETHVVESKAFWGAYSVSKSALANLAAVWADESEGQTRVRFNLCLPGPVDSPMRARSHPGELASQLRSAKSLAPYFLFLAASGSEPRSGFLLDCRSDR